MDEKEPFGFQKAPLTAAELSEKLDRVDELVSLLLDEEFEEGNLRELEGLLTESPQARAQYVDMVQLHTDLLAYYQPETFATQKSPILAHLNEPIDVLPPTSQNTTK